MKLLMTLYIVLFSLTTLAENDPHKADRAQLRAIFDNMETALNQRDFIQAAKHLDKNGVITYYNAEVTVGHAQGKQYFDRMLNQSDGIVSDYSLTADISAPAIFHGDSAVAYGITEEKFILTEGLEFTLNGHWSATLHRKANDWKIVNLHFSANLFDNPLLRTAQKMQWIIGAIAFLAGITIFYLFTRFLRKNSSR